MKELTKEQKAVEKVYEVCSVSQDILYEAERGKITWLEALSQLRDEFKSIKIPKGK
jgi:hypothetical protein